MSRLLQLSLTFDGATLRLCPPQACWPRRVLDQALPGPDARGLDPVGASSRAFLECSGWKDTTGNHGMTYARPSLVGEGCSSGAGGVGLIPANTDVQKV